MLIFFKSLVDVFEAKLLHLVRKDMPMYSGLLVKQVADDVTERLLRVAKKCLVLVLVFDNRLIDDFLILAIFGFQLVSLFVLDLFFL